VILRNRQHKGIPLAEAQGFCAVFQAFHSPVKLLKLNALAVAVADPLGIHEDRKRRVVLDLGELRHDVALVVGVEVDHARHFFHRTADYRVPVVVFQVHHMVKDGLVQEPAAVFAFLGGYLQNRVPEVLPGQIGNGTALDFDVDRPVSRQSARKRRVIRNKALLVKLTGKGNCYFILNCGNINMS